MIRGIFFAEGPDCRGGSTSFSKKIARSFRLIFTDRMLYLSRTLNIFQIQKLYIYQKRQGM